MQKTGNYLPTYKGCVICGQKSMNPHALEIRFRITEKGVETEFIPDKKQEGYKNIVHGGILSALLDETIGWAVAVNSKKYFVTVDLNVRFRKSLPVGKKVLVKGKALSFKGRIATGEGMIIDDDGVIYTTATARFFLLPDNDAKMVHDYLSFQEDDMDILSSE